MEKVTDIANMSPDAFREFLSKLVNEPIFIRHEKLTTLLSATSSSANMAKLEEAFREFFCGYQELALWLEEYEEDPLEGIEPHTPRAKKLKRHLNYIDAHRKTTRKQRIFRRMGTYLNSDTMPEKKIAALPPDEFRALLQGLVRQELFISRARLAALLKQGASCKALDAAFGEFFVAYELFELALEDYHYEPDEGLELRPEFVVELDQVDAYIKAGGKMWTLEEAFREFEGMCIET